jgi:hypothetical protein
MFKQIILNPGLLLVDYLLHKISYLLNFAKTFFSNQQLHDWAINQNVVLIIEKMHISRTVVFSSTMTWLKLMYCGEEDGWLELSLQLQSFSEQTADLCKSDFTNLMEWTLVEVPSCQIFIMWKDNVIICCITLMAFSKNPCSILSLFRCEASGITNKLHTVRSEVITQVLLRMEVFWDMTLCH